MTIQTNFFDGLGTKVKASSKHQVLKEANLDFNIIERDAYYLGDLDLGFTRLKNKKVILRKDNYAVLGVVSEKYSVVSMTEALSLFDPFVEEGHLNYEYAGSSYNSKKESLKFWVLLSLNKDYYEVTKGDYILPYLLVSNSFDGNCGLWIRSTAIRFFCDNQTHLLLKENSDKFVVHHTGESRERFLRKGRVWLDQLLVNNQKTVKLYEKMNDRILNLNEFRNYLETVFPQQYKTEKTWLHDQRLSSDFAKPDEYCKPYSLYAAYNAVTKLLTHELGLTAESRFYSYQWGSNFSYSNRAFKVAESVVK